MQQQRRWLQLLERSFLPLCSWVIGNGKLKKPRLAIGAFVLSEVLLALGAIAIHRSGLEVAFFQPALNAVFGEADI
jgi:hypothetical protein